MAGKSSTAPGKRPSVREELARVLEESAGVDEFVHGMMAFLVELSHDHPNHPLLGALGEELSRVSAAPLSVAAMHDLRSILQGVVGGLDYAPVLLERSGVIRAAYERPGSDKVDANRISMLREAIDDARVGMRLAAELAQEALQVSRDCVAADAGPVQLNAVIESATRLAARKVPLELEFETSDALEVRAGRSAITRVLINLLRNAVQAVDELENREGAGVLVSTWASEEFAFVSVADEGPGIPDAVRASIFELFFTTHGEGTGVGLHVCKTLVDRWGGMIHVDSRPKEGARFTFSVPLVRAKD